MTSRPFLKALRSKVGPTARDRQHDVSIFIMIESSEGLN